MAVSACQKEAKREGRQARTCNYAVTLLKIITVLSCYEMLLPRFRIRQQTRHV